MTDGFRHFILNHKVVVIFDGLDEITDLQLRNKVILSLEDFIGKYIVNPQTNTIVDNLRKCRGSQLIVTSR